MTLELKKRLMTGVFGATALILLVVLGGPIGVFLLTTVLSLGMMVEFSEMTLSLVDRVEKKYVLLSLTWFVALVNLFAPQLEFQLLTFSFFGLFSYFLITAERHSEAVRSRHFKELMSSLFGLVYLVFTPFYLRKIYESPHGIQWTLLFLLIVWTGDSGAYFAGKKWGRHKLYPAISPKKTVEGALGGLAAGVLFAFGVKWTFFKDLSGLAAVFLPLFVGTIAQVGDLGESFLKRAFGIKDSGTILPGHGGLLDRFDGVVFSLPVMYACVRLFN